MSELTLKEIVQIEQKKKLMERKKKNREQVLEEPKQMKMGKN